MCDQFSFHKMTIFINTAPLKIRKSANVGQFYPLKPTILYKVDPRKFHVIINIAPLKHPKIRNVGQIYPLKTTIFYKVAPWKFHVIINIAPLKSSWKGFCVPAKAVSFLENGDFLSHRPSMYALSTILCVYKMWSRPRGILVFVPFLFGNRSMSTLQRRNSR